MFVALSSQLCAEALSFLESSWSTAAAEVSSALLPQTRISPVLRAQAVLKSVASGRTSEWAR